MKTSYDPPIILKKIFSSFYWNSVTDKILLTFDDGPNSETTDIILKELDNFSVKSIFFCVGENLEKYPSLAKEIIAEGHILANHTQKHQKLTELSNSSIDESIEKVQRFATEYLDYKISYFRPPHGRFTLGTKKILKKYDLQNVMWSLLTYDYKNDLNIVKFALGNYLNKDSIIVLHDNNKSKDIIADSIKLAVEETQKRNYQFGTPTECLKYSSS